MNPVTKKPIGFKPQTLQVFATGTGRSLVAQSINEQRSQILERSLIQESVHRTGDDFSPYNTINS